jgi:hypothetical protein
MLYPQNGLGEDPTSSSRAHTTKLRDGSVSPHPSALTITEKGTRDDRFP